MSSSVGEIPTHGMTSAMVTGATCWALALTLSTSVVSLVLAMAGALTPWLAFPLIAAVSILIGRALPKSSPEPVPARVAFALVALLLIVVSVGVARPHEHILATRDSGTYVSTAAWVSRTGSLAIDAATREFEGSPVVYETLGFLAGDSESRLNAQFLHAFPAMLALADMTFATPMAMFWVAPILGGVGLLSFFALARSLVGSSGALLGTAAVSMSLPFLYFTRAPFSETLAFCFLFGGLWALHHAFRSRSPGMASVAGLLIGGVALARIDGIVVLLGLAVHRALIDLDDRESTAETSLERRLADRAFLAALSLWGLSLVDAIVFSPQYLVDHGDLIALVVGAILVVRLSSRLAPRARPFMERRRALVSRAASIFVGAYLGYAWLLRSLVEAPTQSDVYGLEGLQRAAGLAVEPLRSYGELSVHWLAWYLGIPVLGMAIVGLAALTRQVVHRPTDEAGPFFGVVLVATLLYVYRPSINPDHIWAMRRFVPVVVPGLVIAAVWMWRRIAERFKIPLAASVGVGLVALMPIALTTAAAGLEPEFDGAAEAVTAACDAIGSNSAILFVGEGTDSRSNALLPLLRGWCGVAAAAEDSVDPLVDEDLARIAERARHEGRTVWLVDGDPGQGGSVEIFDSEFRYLEITLVEPPDDYATLPVKVSVRALES